MCYVVRMASQYEIKVVVDRELKKRLEVEAESEGRSLSNLCAQLLRLSVQTSDALDEAKGAKRRV